MIAENPITEFDTCYGKYQRIESYVQVVHSERRGAGIAQTSDDDRDFDLGWVGSRLRDWGKRD